MSDTKILQAILDGQRALKEELKKDIDNVRKDIEGVEEKVDCGFEKVNSRIDKLGLDLASLSDDAPTIDEFDNLEKRVTKLEHLQVVTD